jgi:hypothetical protein
MNEAPPPGEKRVKERTANGSQGLKKQPGQVAEEERKRREEGKVGLRGVHMYTAVCVPIPIPSFQSCKAEANQERHSVVIKRRAFDDDSGSQLKTDTVQPLTCRHLHDRPIA